MAESTASLNKRQPGESLWLWLVGVWYHAGMVDEPHSNLDSVDDGNPSMDRVRFSLRWLLIAMAGFAVLLALARAIPVTIPAVIIYMVLWIGAGLDWLFSGRYFEEPYD